MTSLAHAPGHTICTETYSPRNAQKTFYYTIWNVLWLQSRLSRNVTSPCSWTHDTAAGLMCVECVCMWWWCLCVCVVLRCMDASHICCRVLRVLQCVAVVFREHSSMANYFPALSLPIHKKESLFKKRLSLRSLLEKRHASENHCFPKFMCGGMISRMITPSPRLHQETCR